MYLCFLSIFCGQRRPEHEDRLVQVHYSDIVKWELRSVDRYMIYVLNWNYEVLIEIYDI